MVSSDTADLAPFLDPGERILWQGKPRQGLIWRADDWSTMPVSVLRLALSLLWTSLTSYAFASAIAHRDHLEWPFLLAFVLVGMASCFAAFQSSVGRFFRDAHERARTRYAISNARAFLIRTGHDGFAAALPLSRDTEFTVNVDRHGLGTLSFMHADAILIDARPGQEAPSHFAFADAPHLEEAAAMITRIKDNPA